MDIVTPAEVESAIEHRLEHEQLAEQVEQLHEAVHEAEHEQLEHEVEEHTDPPAEGEHEEREQWRGELRQWMAETREQQTAIAAGVASLLESRLSSESTPNPPETEEPAAVEVTMPEESPPSDESAEPERRSKRRVLARYRRA